MSGGVYIPRLILDVQCAFGCRITAGSPLCILWSGECIRQYTLTGERLAGFVYAFVPESHRLRGEMVRGICSVPHT